MKMKVVLLVLASVSFWIFSLRAQPAADAGATTNAASAAEPGHAPAPPASAQPAAAANVGGTTNAHAGEAKLSTNAVPGAGQGQGAPIIAVPSNPGEIQRDQALNPTDASLLQQMRQSVLPPGQPGGEAVHFIL